MPTAKITSFFKPNISKEAKPQKLGGASNKKRSSKILEDPETTKRLKTDNGDELLSSLKSESWRSALKVCLKSNAFARLGSFVHKERATQTIYPPVRDTWTALNACSFDDVKVVIVGQDPYHGPHQAHGLCFSVLPGERPPPSLKNIYKELSQDPKVSFVIPDHGHLLTWAQQGVLMLNAVMTVRKGNANSHKKQGWEEVTDHIIQAVNKRPGKGCVFLLWGKPATSKALQVIGGSAPAKHTVICTSHPSPLGATKTSSPFLGSRCFSRCNEALVAKGHTPINWNLNGTN